MKLPWVSRRAYEVVVTYSSIGRADLEAANARIDKLTDTLTSLRRYGFDPERPVPTELEQLPDDNLNDVIQEAIEELAVPGEPLYRDLVRHAYRELGKNPDPEVVAGIISAGADTEDM